MSISSVVTRGYGTWSTVNKLPTWGYSIGIPPAATAPQDGWVSQQVSRVVYVPSFGRVVVAYPERVR